MSNHKFNIERAKAGDNVVTRDGRKAEYVFTLRNKPDQFIYLFKLTDESGKEDALLFSSSGRLCLDDKVKTQDDLFMSEPEIPADCIKYDPNVPPPEMADELEMFYAGDESPVVASRSFFSGDWSFYNNHSNKRTHYKVTRWKLPEGFKPHMGGERPADAFGSGKVCFCGGSEPKSEHLEEWNWLWTSNQHDWGTNIIGYLPDVKEQDLDSIIQELCEVIGETDNVKTLLQQFAKAIVVEAKK